jgi:hypothetical protein
VVVAATDMEAHVEEAIRRAKKAAKKQLRADSRTVEELIDQL